MSEDKRFTIVKRLDLKDWNFDICLGTNDCAITKIAESFLKAIDINFHLHESRVNPLDLRVRVMTEQCNYDTTPYLDLDVSDEIINVIDFHKEEPTDASILELVSIKAELDRLSGIISKALK